MSTRTTSAASPVEQRNALSPTNMSKALFFAAAGISFLLSIWLWFSGDRERGLFVGLWVPSILSLGALVMSDNLGSS